MIQFILSQDPTINLEEAQEKAHKIPADGESFYGISKEEFRDELGPIGGVIHRVLQTSKFGYVSELSQISTRSSINVDLGMAGFGLRLKWLEYWVSSWVYSTEDGSFGWREATETTHYYTSSYLSSQHLSWPTRSVKPHQSSTASGVPNDSKSEKQLLDQDHGGCGQVNLEDSFGSVRYRCFFRSSKHNEREAF